MGKTHKERDKRDLPRVPHWIRTATKPTRPHGKGVKRPQDDSDPRDEYLESLMYGDRDE